MNGSYTEKPFEKYDAVEDPVFYCKGCLSLNIKAMNFNGEETDYCDTCGGTDIGQCSIYEWERLYRERYGHDYVDRTKPKKTRYY